MAADLFSEHPNEEALLAYLDGELSRARTRSIRNHLKICWEMSICAHGSGVTSGNDLTSVIRKAGF